MTEEFEPKQAEEGFEKAKSKAKDLFEHPEQAKKLLEDAIHKAGPASGALEKVWEELQLMFSLIKDWLSGAYREVPKGSIVAILAGLIYFISPIDVIPDFIPIAGYIDDVFVLGLVINQVRADLHKYKAWKDIINV